MDDPAPPAPPPATPRQVRAVILAGGDMRSVDAYRPRPLAATTTRSELLETRQSRLTLRTTRDG